MQALIDEVCRYADVNNAPETAFETGIEGFTVFRCRRRTSIEHNLYHPLLCVVLQGRKECSLGDRFVGFGAGDSLIVSLNLPTSSRILEASETRPYVALALAIRIPLIQELSREIGDEASAPEASEAVSTGRADESLVAAIGKLFEIVDRPLEQKVMVPLILREIHFRMLLAGHGEMLRRLSVPSSYESRVARAIDHIRDRFPATVSVSELARTAGLSASSFHEHFKQITETTPLQFQKDMKLLEARQRLMGSGKPVSTVAYDVGYESPAQFSREYARKFGMPPSKDRAAQEGSSLSAVY